MFILDAATKKIEAVLGGAVTTTQPTFFASYVDVTTTTYVPASSAGAMNNATPVDIVTAPASSTQRQIKQLTWYNADTASITLTVQLDISGTDRILWKGTLLTGESVIYEDPTGWIIYSATGRALTTAGDVVGPSSATDNAIARFDATTGKLIQDSAVTIDDSGNIVTSALVDGIDPSAIGFASPWGQRVWMSPLNRGGAAKILTSGTAYFCYVGRTVNAITPKFVEFHVSTIGAGAQTAEVGLFSSPLGPNKAAQSLTKLVSTSTVDSLTSTGVKRNTSAFATSVAAGTHLWAGIRTAMATTQPTIEGLNFDMGQGQALVAAASGALTGAGPFSGVLLGTASLHGATSDVPDLRVTID